MKVLIWLAVLIGTATTTPTTATTAAATTNRTGATTNRTAATTNRTGAAAAAAVAAAAAATTKAILNRRSWPLRHYDIWNAVDDDLPPVTLNTNNLRANEDPNPEAVSSVEVADDDFDEFVATSGGDGGWRTASGSRAHTPAAAARRNSKVLHLFPVPVDGECLSADGRRTGTCYNPYQCRAKGGSASGECAMGFGVCCIFTVMCNETISNNITYLVSSNFPSFMPRNVTACQLKVKLLSEDISQLRVDFFHFSLGQPNRRTGVCDGDVLRIRGGPAGTFSLCGQNSGQHIYYDVGGRSLPRQALYGNLRPLTYAQVYPQAASGDGSANATREPLIEISMNFSERFLPIRLWEIRIAQIPFSQRAPAGCLQYHTGREGVLQTFNFAENGRHLAHQNYRICMRQETDMCSIVYQPCDQQSFRIAPNRNAASAGAAGAQSGTRPSGAGTSPNGLNGGATSAAQMTAADGASTAAMSSSSNGAASTLSTAMSNTTVTTTTMPTNAEATTTAATATATPTPTTSASAAAEDMAPSSSAPPDAAADEAQSSTTTAAPADSSPLSDDVEGSGGDLEDDEFSPESSSRRPRPVSGGFDLLGFLRNTFDFGSGRRLRTPHQLAGTQQRQFYSSCTDRITLPCIVEDFIGAGMDASLGIPACEPVHCGASFCSSGAWPCRIESTVTPFYVSVNFGAGANKGSPEDNIGACLRYTQVQCM